MTEARKWVAVDFGGPEVLRCIDVDVPDPGPGQVMIGVRAVGMNPADAKHIAPGQDRGLLPLSIGFEVAGVVTALGPGTQLASGGGAIGDEVVASQIRAQRRRTPLPGGAEAQRCSSMRSSNVVRRRASARVSALVMGDRDRAIWAAPRSASSAPAGVRSTSTPRPSSGLAARCRRPRRSARSTRPEIVDLSSPR